MDFMNRGTRPNPAANGGAAHATTAGPHRRESISAWFRITFIVLLFSATILVIALLFTLVFSKTNRESRYVDSKKLQAVFLNGGQVYFGHINALNPEYVTMSGIYYLRVNQQVQPNQSNNQNNDISLVKLGCELHGPVDQMVINRDQVLFWENLKSDGQVAKAVDQYVKQNPSGQKCDTTNASSSNSSSTPSSSDTTKKQ